VTNGTAFDAVNTGFIASPLTAGSTGRYDYGISADQVVRYMGMDGATVEAMCGASACAAGDPIGTAK